MIFADKYTKGIVIWSALDPANPFISPTSAPFVIGFSYAAMIMGFADITISTNLARDLGTRIVAAIFYGGEVSHTNLPEFIPLKVRLATITNTNDVQTRPSLTEITPGSPSSSTCPPPFLRLPFTNA